MPQAGVGVHDRVSVILSKSSANVISGKSQNHNIADPDATCTYICTPAHCTMNTDNNLMKPNSMTSPQSQLTPVMGVAASTMSNSWVLFQEGGSEEPTCTSQVASVSKLKAGKKEGWVKFQTSPQPPRHAMSLQLTGNSSVPSFDQSDIAVSVLSDNVSHEYLPSASSLPSSSATSTLSVPGLFDMANWVKFEEQGQVPVHVESPPQYKIQPTSKSASIQTGAQDTKQIKAWVSFYEPGSSTPPSPVLSHSSDSPNEETAEIQQQRQQMQQALAVQQQQWIQSRQQQQELHQIVTQSSYQQHVHPHLSGKTLQNPAVSITPIASFQQPSYHVSDESSSVQPLTSTPLSGNPFREEMLRQQACTGSPFNPFQAGGPIQTPSTPGGTVSAMWGESPITPRTVDAMWEKFEENSTSAAMAMSANMQVQSTHEQQIVLSETPAKEVFVPVAVASTQQGASTLKEKAQEFQSHSASEQSPAASTLSTTPAQSTPVTAQPFQRHTKASKQVTIRASGKKPKVTQNQQDDVLIDDTPFIDEFPKKKCNLSEGWPMMLRCPDKKIIAGHRFWRPVQVKLLEGNVIQLFDQDNLSEPFRELPLQCNYEFGDKKRQAYDTLGKIHTIKLIYVSFSEKGRYSTRIPHEKVANTYPLLKLGSTDYYTFRSFISTVIEYMMKLSSSRDRGISYKQDAIGIVVSDEYRCRIGSNGELEKQSTVVTLTVLAFLSDMPDCSISLNDVQVKGLEVVSRRDIIPNKIIHWIKLENVELHKCANTNVFVESRFIEFQPLDGCRFCLMKFHTRPRQNMELPLHVKVTVAGEGTFLELRADLVLPARPGRRDSSQFICTDIMIRIPIPETWIKYFRREWSLGVYSIKSAHGKPDHIKKGSLNPKLLETSIGSAKYEHAYRAIVWRIEKLPEKSTASHILMCRLHVASHREVPRTPIGEVKVEFTMPQTTASRTTVRFLSVASDKPAEKRIRYMAHYGYFVEMENKVILQVLDEDGGLPQCTQQ